MSFGFGVSDFITVVQLAHTVYNSCKDAPRDFDIVTKEVNSLCVVLKKTADCLEKHDLGEHDTTELCVIKEGCERVLEDVQDMLQRYKQMTRKKWTWQRVRWGSVDIPSLRHRLTVNVTLLATFYTTLTHASQFRVERTLNRLVEKVSTNESMVDKEFECEPDRQMKRHLSSSTTSDSDATLCESNSGSPTAKSTTPSFVETGHQYHSISSERGSLQINGDVGRCVPSSTFRFKHAYANVKAHENSRQINGNLFDPEAFFRLMNT